MKINLNDLVPLWERKFPDLMNDTVFERVARSNVNVAGPLAQDSFSALVISQGGIKRGLQAS